MESIRIWLERDAARHHHRRRRAAGRVTRLGSAATERPPAPFGKTCLACHGDDVIRQQRPTRAQWDAELTKMTGWGARVSDQDRGVLLEYLAANFGPRP